MNRKTRWGKPILGFVLTLLALILSFRKFDWGLAKKSLAQLNVLWALLAVGNSFLIVYLLGLRWRLLLLPERRPPLTDLFRLNILGQFVNILLPGRFGELARTYLASREFSLSGAFTLGTVAVEKLLDFIVFICLWISVPLLFAGQNGLRGAGAAAAAGLAIVVLLTLLLLWRSRAEAGLIKLSGVFGKKMQDRLRTVIGRGLDAFSRLRSVRALGSLLVLSLVFVGGQVLTNALVFKAVNLPFSLWAGLLVLLAVQAGNIPPSLPGKIGIFEYSVILALSFFRVDPTQALTYALILHIVAFLPKILLGMIYISTDKHISLNRIIIGIKDTRNQDEE